MKKCLVLLMLFSSYACASQSVARNEESVSLHVKIPAQTMDESVLLETKQAKPLFGKVLSNVKVSKTSFNPKHGEKVAISFNLSKQAKVTAYVYDPDWGLIKTIIADKNIAQGEQTFSWDGKDMDGNVVPDEAYFFTVIAEDKAGDKEIYDPTAFSGGIWHDITDVNIDSINGTINYKMPEMGRVLIRIGVEAGPLLHTLIDWKPRVKGAITEYWNGKDQDNLIDLYDNPKFKMLLTYFTLPENSVIAYGNNTQIYKEYKKSFTSKRPVKIERYRSVSVSKLSPHYKLPRTMDYSPELKVEFINKKGTDSDGTIILREKTLVKVALNEEDKVIFQNQQFEIVFFLDNEFYAEDEAGYTPFNWVWDLSNVEEGEHVLTVNLSSFKDQIGVLSRKVRVVK